MIKQTTALLKVLGSQPERRHAFLYSMIALSRAGRSEAILDLYDHQIDDRMIYSVYLYRDQTAKRRWHAGGGDKQAELPPPPSRLFVGMMEAAEDYWPQMRRLTTVYLWSHRDPTVVSLAPARVDKRLGNAWFEPIPRGGAGKD